MLQVRDKYIINLSLDTGIVTRTLQIHSRVYTFFIIWHWTYSNFLNIRQMERQRAGLQIKIEELQIINQSLRENW